MNQRNWKLAIIALALLLLAGLGPTISSVLPTIPPAKAITCPTGGAANACLTVSLDAISRPTTTASATCAVPTGQNGVCDISINTAASNATTFRIGAILNATSVNRATSNISCGGASQISCGVAGWQFAINYDPTIVTPGPAKVSDFPLPVKAVGDPSSFCTSYPDCGEKAVWYGSQTSFGTANWAGFLQSGSANCCVPANFENPATHTGKITVGFAFFQSAPVVLSARTVLASVAFELVGKGTATFTISDVIFADQNGVTIPGITSADPSGPCVSGQLPSSYCGSPTVTVTNDPPHANFSVTQVSSYVFSFNSASTDSDGTIADPAGYFWDFGDGTQDLATHGSIVLTHDYSSTCATGCPNGAPFPGNFDVTLRVVDDMGATGSARDDTGGKVNNAQPSHTFRTILVDAPPVPTFTFSPSNPAPSQSITFDASASRDPDGILSSYTWDFNDSTTGAGVTTTHSFAVAKVFHVKLTLTDNAGLMSTKTVDVTVSVPDQPPTLTLTGPTSATAGTATTISLSSSDPDGTVSTVKVDWGDGNIDTVATSATSASHNYSAPGSYTITVTVTDNSGITTQKTTTVTVAAAGGGLPGGILTLIAIPIVAIVAIALFLFRRRGRSRPPTVPTTK